MEVQLNSVFEVNKKNQLRVSGRSLGELPAKGDCEVFLKTKNEGCFLVEGSTKFRYSVN